MSAQHPSSQFSCGHRHLHLGDHKALYSCKSGGHAKRNNGCGSRGDRLPVSGVLSRFLPPLDAAFGSTSSITTSWNLAASAFSSSASSASSCRIGTGSFGLGVGFQLLEELQGTSILLRSMFSKLALSCSKPSCSSLASDAAAPSATLELAGDVAEPTDSASVCSSSSDAVSVGTESALGWATCEGWGAF